MSDFFKNIPSIPPFKPAYNVGGLFDIPTGSYFLSDKAESVLNGGLHGLISIVGPGNSFKTVIVAYLNLTVADRIKDYQFSVYDTENSLSYNRMLSLSSRFNNLSGVDQGDDTLSGDKLKYRITSSAELLGDEYFDVIKNIAKEKEKVNKTLTTPMIGPNGNKIKSMLPTGAVIDSLSEFKDTTSEDKFSSKNAVGNSANNMMYMRQGLAKKMLIAQLPNLNSKAEMVFTLTAHVGTAFEGGMYDPKPHKLTYSKRGSKVIGATGAFDFINSAIYEIQGVSKLSNKERNTGVLYPLLDSDRVGDGTDLMQVKIVLIRNKFGSSGAVLPIVLSQREGLLPHLTQFHYIKLHDRYGMIGSKSKYSLSIYPDVSLTRSTVRSIIDSDPLLCRALEITSELHQILTLWDDLPNDLMCTPEELYNDIKTLGYDWNKLLDTRSWWVFEGDEKGLKPFLSTMDLLRIRKGIYSPKKFKLNKRE